MAIVELKSLSKRYGPLVALNDVTLDVPPGVVGLLGPNGAGKSTLIGILLGHIPPTGGSGRVMGYDIRRQQRRIRRQIGFVPENDCFIPNLSGVGYVHYTARLAGMDYASAMQRTHEVLDLVGMGDERYRPVETYSTGMKQRAKLGQALVHDPKLLLLDEPTNGLDPQGRRHMLATIRNLGQQGISVILSSHLLHDVEEVCGHVVVLGCGRVLLDGDVAHLMRPSAKRCLARIRGDAEAFERRLNEVGVGIYSQGPVHWELRLPEDGRFDLVISAARDASVQLRELRPQRSSLEQTFLRAIVSQQEGQIEATTEVM